MEWIFRKVERQFLRARITPGESVGILATHTISPPPPFEFFHLGSLAGVNCYRDPPTRLALFVRSLPLGLQYTHTLTHTKSLLSGEDTKDEWITLHVSAAAFVYSELYGGMMPLRLRDLMISSTIHYDPNPAETTLQQDREWLSLYSIFPDTDIDCTYYIM